MKRRIFFAGEEKTGSKSNQADRQKKKEGEALSLF
jgi:hypothetical protein